MCFPINDILFNSGNIELFTSRRTCLLFNCYLSNIPLRTKLTFSSGKKLIFWDNDPLGW